MTGAPTDTMIQKFAQLVQTIYPDGLPLAIAIVSAIAVMALVAAGVVGCVVYLILRVEESRRAAERRRSLRRRAGLSR